MILQLSILRGVNLMAMDTNLISANSSDPYCEVWINGTKKIGWTPTQTATLNPVWGGPTGTFSFQGGGGTKVDIKLYDYDELTADDPMGTVSFYVKDLLDREARDHYPNFWASVEPPKGYENVPAGRLQIRLLKVSEKDNKRDSLAKPVSTSTNHVTVAPGPALADVSDVHQHIATAKTPIILHVYDVGKNAKIHNLNCALPYTGMGGIFHGGIEVYGREYSFGGARNDVCGIFTSKPASCPMHTYRESIYLGDCRLNRQQVVAILKRMKPDWMAPTYNLLKKNCCSFSNELAIELGLGGIPDWVITLAHIAADLNDMMGREDNAENLLDFCERRATWRSLETKENQHMTFADATLEYIMAVRLQRKFRARHAKVQGGKKLEANGVDMCTVSSDPHSPSLCFYVEIETCDEEHHGFVHIHRATINRYDGKGFETAQVQIRRATMNAYDGLGFEVKD